MTIRGDAAKLSRRTGPAVLTNRALNRALLARQLLLRRSDYDVHSALTHLVGMQAQTPNAPYIALWSRLKDFQPKLLTSPMLDRRVVRIAMMRSTIHSVTQSDCLELRPHFSGVLERGMRGAFGKQLKNVELKRVEAAARELLKKGPLTFDELGRALSEKWPKADAAALANAARAMIPLVQIPPRGIWGEGGPAMHVPAESWLGKPLSSAPDLERLVYRYLVAFGPATVRDVQTWSGLTGLRATVEAMREKLATFVDEEGNELFDVPDGPRPDPETQAPPRFLPVFDNVLLSHANRRRILSEAHRRMLFGTAALLEGTVLVDGFVGAKWKITQDREQAVLVVQPFAALSARDQAAASDEGMRLLQFAVPNAAHHDVLFTKPIG